MEPHFIRRRLRVVNSCVYLVVYQSLRVVNSSCVYLVVYRSLRVVNGRCVYLVVYQFLRVVNSRVLCIECVSRGREAHYGVLKA